MEFICNNKVYKFEENIKWISVPINGVSYCGVCIIDQNTDKFYKFENTKSNNQKITLNYSIVDHKDNIKITKLKGTNTLFLYRCKNEWNLVNDKENEVTIFIKINNNEIEKILFIFDKCEKDLLEKIEGIQISKI